MHVTAVVDDEDDLMGHPHSYQPSVSYQPSILPIPPVEPLSPLPGTSGMMSPTVAVQSALVITALVYRNKPAVACIDVTGGSFQHDGPGRTPGKSPPQKTSFIKKPADVKEFRPSAPPTHGKGTR